MPITPWPQYADHPLALICRSRLGSYMPVGDNGRQRVDHGGQSGHFYLAESGHFYLGITLDRPIIRIMVNGILVA